MKWLTSNHAFYDIVYSIVLIHKITIKFDGYVCVKALTISS